jgi:lipopolysaccharide export system protein LptA
MNVRTLAFTLAVVVPSIARAQGAAPPAGRCQFELPNTPNTHVQSIQLPSKQNNYWFGGGVIAVCKAQKLVLKSDSLEVYGDEGRYFFIGHVDYVEPRLKLKSDFLTYFQRDERLLAVQNVDARLPSGSTLKGPSLEFFRTIPKIRPQQRGIAVARPTITLIDKDPQGKSQDTVTVTGNTVWLQGDSVVSSQGEVVVVRPQLTATGDSLYLDNGKGLARLMRNPKLAGKKDRPFTLVGETIDILSQRRKVDRLLSTNKAIATSEDMNLQSDTIDLRISDDKLQRAISWGKSRSHATSPTQTIVADSIDVLLPAQRVREMHAVRMASAEGSPDTTKFRTTEKDRLTGDTIVAYFDSIPAGDTTSKPRINRLVAIGHATSLQHLAPRDTCIRVPAINYARGRLITVTFDSGRVNDVVVIDREKQAGGLYVEPDPDSASMARCKTTKADTSAAGKNPAPRSTPPARGTPPATPPPGLPSPTVVAVPPATPGKRP